jgi:hypothetical protein
MLDYSRPAPENKDGYVSTALARWRELLDEVDDLDPFGVLGEFAGSCSPLTGDVIRALAREFGLEGLAALIARWHAGDDEPRIARVEYCEHGRRFEFIDEPGAGVGAMVFAVRDPCGIPVDLAAWSPPRPPATWLGAGALLGAWNLFRPRMREALMVHQGPLDWLRDACRGVVVVNERNAAPLLRHAEPLRVSNVEPGIKLRKMLTLPPPQILISLNEEEMAA